MLYLMHFMELGVKTVKFKKFLKNSKVPYTHSGIESSSKLAMDKFKSGKIFIQDIIFLIQGHCICSLKDLIGSNPMNYPYVIKPNDNGSSVGVAND